MTSVDLLRTETSRLTTEVGWLDFYAVPIQTPYDFACVPDNVVSFADARRISADFAHQVVAGRIGPYQWRTSPQNVGKQLSL